MNLNLMLMKSVYLIWIIIMPKNSNWKKRLIVHLKSSGIIFAWCNSSLRTAFRRSLENNGRNKGWRFILAILLLLIVVYRAASWNLPISCTFPFLHLLHSSSAQFVLLQQLQSYSINQYPYWAWALGNFPYFIHFGFLRSTIKDDENQFGIYDLEAIFWGGKRNHNRKVDLPAI